MKSAINKLIIVICAILLFEQNLHAVLPPEEQKKFEAAYLSSVDIILTVRFLGIEADDLCKASSLAKAPCRCTAAYEADKITLSPPDLKLSKGSRIELPFRCVDKRPSWLGSYYPWWTKSDDGSISASLKAADLKPGEAGTWVIANEQNLYAPAQ